MNAVHCDIIDLTQNLKKGYRLLILTKLDGIVDCVSEFGGYLTKLTVIQEFIETLPGGRVVAGRVVQPVRENSLTTLLIVHSLSPHLNLLPGNHQVANLSPLVHDGLL